MAGLGAYLFLYITLDGMLKDNFIITFFYGWMYPLMHFSLNSNNLPLFEKLHILGIFYTKESKMKFLQRFIPLRLFFLFAANAESGIYDVQKCFILPGTIQFNAHAYDVKKYQRSMLDFCGNKYMKDRPYI